MAAYEKQTWVDGETITKAKLDHIEEGIANIELTPGPKGEPGTPGDKGDPGAKGDKGDEGDTGFFGMKIKEDGHLYAMVNDSKPIPPLEIDERGHLIYRID